MLTELWRITSFRLTVLYGGVFTLAVVALLGSIYAETAKYQNRQIDQILRNEAHIFSSLSSGTLVKEISHEMEMDVRHIHFYGLFASDGSPLAGNLPHAPRGFPFDGEPHAVPVKDNPDLFRQEHGIRAVGKKLRDGNLMIVARDAVLLEQIRQSLLEGCVLIGGVILVVGVLGGVFYSLPALRHIHQIDQTVRRIATGDYTQRLPQGKRNHELDTLATIVNAMLDETERLMGEVKSCSDNIAHDLRTPLTRLRAIIYRAQQKSEETSSVRLMLDQALTEIEFLLTRFRALSRISEIEGGQRRAGFSQASAGRILQTALELYEPLAAEKGINLALHLKTSATLRCDKELLLEAVANLVDNAIKFTPAPGSVRLSLEHRDEGPVILVEDSGPGIPPEQRKSVMQRFYRMPGSHNIPGSGLGLSLVDAVARLHHFTFVLEDAEGGGTCAKLLCGSTDG